MSNHVAFVGLGVMGREMARHLAASGYALRVWNRTRSKAEDFVGAYGGFLASSPREAAEGADFIVTCVGADHDLRAIVLGDDGLLAGARQGALFVDHTTASADVSVELAQALRNQDIGFVDAPVSGGQRGAEEGRLTIMCGGTLEDFARAESLVGPYAASCLHMGDVGAGQRTKMVNQICFAGVIAGLAEGMAFAENAGLDPARVFEALAKGAAGSWQMSNRTATMIRGEYDFGFAVDWMRKDLGLCLAEGTSNASALPVTQTVAAFYDALSERGLGRADTSALVELHRRRP